jgi:hypothetical protein
MYMFESMIKLADQKWKSPEHKDMAIVLLICNRRITSRRELTECGAIINSLSKQQIRELTLGEAAELGIPR